MKVELLLELLPQLTPCFSARRASLLSTCTLKSNSPDWGLKVKPRLLLLPQHPFAHPDAAPLSFPAHNTRPRVTLLPLLPILALSFSPSNSLASFFRWV